MLIRQELMNCFQTVFDRKSANILEAEFRKKQAEMSREDFESYLKTPEATFKCKVL